MRTLVVILILSVIAFAVAWAETDYNTGRAPRWAMWLGYASLAGFCIAVFGLAWELLAAQALYWL